MTNTQFSCPRCGLPAILDRSNRKAPPRRVTWSKDWERCALKDVTDRLYDCPELDEERDRQAG
jgi:hypothetical protein